MKPKQDDIKKQIQKQNENVYGDEGPGGHMQSLDSDDDVDNPMREAFGDDAVDEEELDIANQIDSDELDAGGITTDEKSAELLERDRKKKKAA